MLTVGLYGIADPRGRNEAHDHAVAFVRDGVVLASLELERVTGRKHDNTLGKHVERLILPWIVPGEGVRFVQANSFLGDRVIAEDRALLLASPGHLPLEPRIFPSRLELRGALGSVRADGFTVPHELAHIGSCLPFVVGGLRPGTLFVHIDGGASVSACSVWHWDGTRLRCLHHGWSDLKAAVNNFNDSRLAARILGLDPAQHLGMPGRLMGLAAHGRPRPMLRKWLEERRFLLDAPESGSRALEVLCDAMGEATPTDATRASIGQDVAACMQSYFEDEVLAFLSHWKTQTRAVDLAYAGGAALNVVANARIESELGFGSVTIPPAPSDAGLAMGAAAIAAWLDGEELRVDSPYLARRTPDDDGGPLAPSSTIGLAKAAERLAAGEVVAAIIGVAEAGPRALGHRSLLARPDSIPIRRNLSERVKGREHYRPVAPIMLPDVARAVLIDFDPESRLSRFMLRAWRVKPEWAKYFAGCIHADGSVRAQVVDPGCSEQAPIAALLGLLRSRHGVWGLINTSLNGPGEPILADRSQAASVARRLGVTAVWGG